MKQIVLAAMVMMTMAGSASAETSAWDYFWGTAVVEAFDPKLNGWDEAFGTTLNPQNTGWDDFWNQCHDKTKTAGDCVGTVAAGIGMVVAAPIVLLSGINAVGLWGVMTVTGSPAVLLAPAMAGTSAGGLVI